nr:MAG TPA: Putative zinc ribbon domain [Caudoviricetes sp.]
MNFNFTQSSKEYCKWCYLDGQFAYKLKESFIDFLVGHMPNPDISEEEWCIQYDYYFFTVGTLEVIISA